MGMFQSFKRALRERATREALDFEFQKLGLDYRSFDPIIRSTMETQAISSGDVRRQVESFLRVARMADKYDLSDAQKKYAIIWSYGPACGVCAQIPDICRISDGASGLRQSPEHAAS
jgi:hypothetical protein